LATGVGEGEKIQIERDLLAKFEEYPPRLD
jgi:hypothetical protein